MNLYDGRNSRRGKRVDQPEERVNGRDEWARMRGFAAVDIARCRFWRLSRDSFGGDR